jgi:hypothetical protein
VSGKELTKHEHPSSLEGLNVCSRKFEPLALPLFAPKPAMPILFENEWAIRSDLMLRNQIFGEQQANPSASLSLGCIRLLGQHPSIEHNTFLSKLTT